MPWWRKRGPTPETSEPSGDPNGPVIRLESVSKVFRSDGEETRALDSKSTLLSILGLLDTPTSGRYFLKGRPTDRLSPQERARVRNLDVGLVFQSFNLIGDMTVYENVEYPLTLRGVAPPEREARVSAALERVGLTARARQRPAVLSGGQQQLVAVARAITGRPAVLLADEPTGNLDSKSGEALMHMFAELHAGGATLCVVTHDPRWLTQAQRRLHLFDGRLVDGPSDG